MRDQGEIKSMVEDCLHELLNEDGCNKVSLSSGDLKVTASMRNGQINIHVTGWDK